jgi:hypothetical protein
MANLTLQEFEEALGVLADGGPPEKLRDRLARLNAFHSRRGLNSLRALSERLFALSSGLRRDVPPARAFQALWMEYVGQRLSEKSGARLDELADAINSHLHEDGSVKEDGEAALEKAVAEYEELLARKIGGVAARLDTLQKAVPAVAAILRARPRLDVPIDPPDAVDDHEHDHDHGHAHEHGHAHAHEPGAGGAPAAHAEAEATAPAAPAKRRAKRASAGSSEPTPSET